MVDKNILDSSIWVTPCPKRVFNEIICQEILHNRFRFEHKIIERKYVYVFTDPSPAQQQHLTRSYSLPFLYTQPEIGNYHKKLQQIKQICPFVQYISCVLPLNQLFAENTSLHIGQVNLIWMIDCRHRSSQYARLGIHIHKQQHRLVYFMSLPPSKALNISVLVTIHENDRSM